MDFFGNHNTSDILKNQDNRNALVKFLFFISYNQFTKPVIYDNLQRNIYYHLILCQQTSLKNINHTN